MAKRIDGNQAEIVRYLQRHGAQVIKLSDAGRDRPDLIACHSHIRQWVFIEIKQPAGRLSRGQIRWLADSYGWCGVATTGEEAFDLVMNPISMGLDEVGKRILRMWLDDNPHAAGLTVRDFRLLTR